MSAHHLNLSLDKMELLFLPGKACPAQRPLHHGRQLHGAKNIAVTMENILSFSNINNIQNSDSLLQVRAPQHL